MDNATLKPLVEKILPLLDKFGNTSQPLTVDDQKLAAEFVSKYRALTTAAVVNPPVKP